VKESSPTGLEERWSFDDVEEAHAMLDALEYAAARAREKAERDAEARRRRGPR
jgi:hypothetical protein